MNETILLVEDDPVQRAIIEMLLRKKLGFKVMVAEHGRQALSMVQDSNVDEISAMLLDIAMPVMDGFETLALLRKLRSDLPVVMLTSKDDTSVAVRAIKEGANDFIIKPPQPDQLQIALRNAIRMSALSRELARLRRDKEGAASFQDLIGCHAGLSEAVAMGRRAAASDVPVLITGETGVGKELFARAVHGESRRSGGAFIAINCGAIPENLVESVLFGHEKGAFTGAIVKTLGKFREAEGGTLFLDELSELPLEAQVKLLRALQQKEVEPVGAGRPVKINVRVIAAANRDLVQEVRQGRFREDLFFRINVLPIRVPPLRERRDDIIPLAEHFIERIAVEEMMPIKRLQPDAQAYLLQHGWPGNVRELQNLLHRSLVLTDGELITASILQDLHHGTVFSGPAEVVSRGMSIELLQANGQFKAMAEIEKECMQRALDHFDQNITKAAEALAIAKSTFYRKIKDV